MPTYDDFGNELGDKYTASYAPDKNGDTTFMDYALSIKREIDNIKSKIKEFEERTKVFSDMISTLNRKKENLETVYMKLKDAKPAEMPKVTREADTNLDNVRSTMRFINDSTTLDPGADATA